MVQANSAMEVFRLLDKSNCTKCGEKTCLAFAGAVYTGRRSLGQCPRLDGETITRFAEAPVDPGSTGAGPEEMLDALRKRLARLDLIDTASRAGGRMQGGRLIVKILGKDFSTDSDGRLSSDIHINPWVVVPFFSYILDGQGLNPAEEWISFREIRNGGKERYPLFQKRCEQSLKKVADSYPDLFRDMVELFHGRQVAEQFASDVSVVLLPLPKVPVMICYWREDEGIGSTLNIFFDRTVNENLGIDGAYTLCAGLVTMFEKVAQHHGVNVEQRTAIAR